MGGFSIAASAANLFGGSGDLLECPGSGIENRSIIFISKHHVTGLENGDLYVFFDVESIANKFSQLS